MNDQTSFDTRGCASAFDPLVPTDDPTGYEWFALATNNAINLFDNYAHSATQELEWREIFRESHPYWLLFVLEATSQILVDVSASDPNDGTAWERAIMAHSFSDLRYSLSDPDSDPEVRLRATRCAFLAVYTWRCHPGARGPVPPPGWFVCVIPEYNIQ